MLVGGGGLVLDGKGSWFKVHGGVTKLVRGRRDLFVEHEGGSRCGYGTGQGASGFRTPPCTPAPDPTGAKRSIQCLMFSIDII